MLQLVHDLSSGQTVGERLVLYPGKMMTEIYAVAIRISAKGYENEH